MVSVQNLLEKESTDIPTNKKKDRVRILAELFSTEEEYANDLQTTVQVGKLRFMIVLSKLNNHLFNKRISSIHLYHLRMEEKKY